MVLEHFLELGRVGEFPGRPARVAAIGLGEPLLDERVEPLLLLEPLARRGCIVEADGRHGGLAVHQDRGRVALAVGFERVLELPFGAADFASGQRSGKPVARQGRAKPRPQNDHDDVGVVRRRDQVLKVMRGQQRLAFPHHRPQIEVEGEFLVESLYHPLGDQPLRPHIPGRGEEYPQCSALGFGHRSDPSRPRA